MKGRTDGPEGHGDAPCGAEEREHAAWRGARGLDRSGLERIDAHAASCARCAAIAGFSRELGDFLRAEAGPHPGTDVLVEFAEDPAGMAAAAHARVSLHVVACESCARELEVLRFVDEPEDAGEPRADRVPGGAAAMAGGRPAWRRFMEACANALFGPAAAAGYLAVALVAIGTLSVRHFGDRPLPAGDTAPASWEAMDPAAPSPEVREIVVLPDAGGLSRGGGAGGDMAVDGDAVIAGDAGAQLLLELTTLESPPTADEMYRVRITRPGGGDAAWQRDIAGAAFGESYSLLLVLPPHALAPGSYVIEMGSTDEGTTSAGGSLYRSRFTVR